MQMKDKTLRPRGDYFDKVTEGLTCYVEWLGGMERIKKIRQLMEQVEQSLQRCPFCGNYAVLRGHFMFSRPGVQVECTHCHCGTFPQWEGLDLQKNLNIPLEQCVRDAAIIWNHREEGAA